MSKRSFFSDWYWFLTVHMSPDNGVKSLQFSRQIHWVYSWECRIRINWKIIDWNWKSKYDVTSSWMHKWNFVKCTKVSKNPNENQIRPNSMAIDIWPHLSWSALFLSITSIWTTRASRLQWARHERFMR